MGSSINIALPSIDSEFATDAILLTWIATSYILSAAMFLVPFGKFSDIHGRKKIFRYGILTYTTSSLLCGVANSVYLLILFRVVQGIGSAMIFSTAIAIITSVFPIGERGKALGINAAGVYSGLSLGPFIGGLLTHSFGWRSIFLINVPLGLILVFALMKLKGEWTEAKGEKFDLTGSAIYIVSIVALMYGLSLLPRPTAAMLILFGILCLLIFIKYESKTSYPILNIGLFRGNTVFAFSNLAALINYSATFAVGFLLSLYLQYIKGLDPGKAGLILAAQPVMMALFSPIAGRISDHVEPRIISSTGMGLTLLGLIPLIFISRETTLLFICIDLVIMGLGFALFASPNTNAVMSSIDKRFYGIASATLGTMRLTGQMLSMGLVMLLFALFIGKVQITSGYYPHFIISIKTAFMIFSLLCFGGIFASLARGKIR